MEPETADAAKIGDATFAVMDYLLDNAEYLQGLVLIKHKRDIYWCYHLSQVRYDLLSVVNDVIVKKYGKLPNDLSDILRNALEEYSVELSESFRGLIPQRIRAAS